MLHAIFDGQKQRHAAAVASKKIEGVAAAEGGGGEDASEYKLGEGEGEEDEDEGEEYEVEEDEVEEDESDDEEEEDKAGSDVAATAGDDREQTLQVGYGVGSSCILVNTLSNVPIRLLMHSC